MFAIEPVFIPEQITGYRFGALLEISDKFSSNDFAVLDEHFVKFHNPTKYL